MPNWTSNRIYIEGEQADIEAFLEDVKWEDKLLDFNRLIPMPDILKRTVSGFTKIHGKEARSWIEEPGADGKAVARVFTAEEQLQLDEIGFQNWYEWANANWGTKWNASHVEIDGHAEHGYLEITFTTAWDAPIPVLHKMIATFPALTFDCRRRHEDESPYPHSLDDAPDAGIFMAVLAKAGAA